MLTNHFRLLVAVPILLVNAFSRSSVLIGYDLYHGRSTAIYNDLSVGSEQVDYSCLESLNSNATTGFGLYKKFADHASEKLTETRWFKEANIPKTLSNNEAPAKGMQNSIVRISTKAFLPSNEKTKKLVQYARITLLETVSLGKNDTTASVAIQTGESPHLEGIQVLNFVVLPSDETTLPVLGIDLVSLPGSKHLLLMDAQPMIQPNPFEQCWVDWYSSYVRENPKFPWGGDFPEEVKQYVSKNALWTRLQDTENPTSIIQNNVWDAYTAHLDTYLNLLEKVSGDIEKVKGHNAQPSYLDYRKNNDPAKPMLNSLYGVEWTQELLNTVLFPTKN